MLNCNCQSIPRRQLLIKIDELSLALIDTMLFLDTHPHDRDALAYYNETLCKYKDLHHMFAEQFYPLLATQADNEQEFCWVNSPMPWEKEAN